MTEQRVMEKELKSFDAMVEERLSEYRNTYGFTLVDDVGEWFILAFPNKNVKSEILAGYFETWLRRFQRGTPYRDMDFERTYAYINYIRDGSDYYKFRDMGFNHEDAIKNMNEGVVYNG